MAQPCQLQTFFHNGSEIDVLPAISRTALADLTRTQHLFHSSHKTVSVIQHQAVKIASLVFGQSPALQRLQIKTDGGDGRFQFVSDSVEEAILLLVAADLSNKKDRVKHQAGNNQAEE